MLSREILLIEPGYPNKYPPLGLMKLAAYHGSFGRGDHVTFIKGEDPEVLNQAWDRVYVTTLFTFEWKRTASAIDFAIRAAGDQPERVFVGGIAVSLMHDAFLNEPRWAGVRFIKGLLDAAPAVSLGLSADDYDFGADDLTGAPIEETSPRLWDPRTYRLRLPSSRRLFRIRVAWVRKKLLVLRSAEAGGRTARDASPLQSS